MPKATGQSYFKASTIDPSYRHLGWVMVEGVMYELVLWSDEYLLVFTYNNQIFHL